MEIKKEILCIFLVQNAFLPLASNIDFYAPTSFCLTPLTGHFKHNPTSGLCVSMAHADAMEPANTWLDPQFMTPGQRSVLGWLRQGLGMSRRFSWQCRGGEACRCGVKGKVIRSRRCSCLGEGADEVTVGVSPVPLKMNCYKVKRASLALPGCWLLVLPHTLGLLSVRPSVHHAVT